MPVIGYCNSPLNNKNTNYHCPVVFFGIGFPYKSLCQLCDCCFVWFNLGFILFTIRILLHFLRLLPNKWYQSIR